MIAVDRGGTLGHEPRARRLRALSNALEGAAVREAEGVTAEAATEPATPGP